MTSLSPLQLQLSHLRGKWIVVEGPDRIGKTTLIRNLQSRVAAQGINVMTNGFPRRATPIGALLDKTLKSREVVRDWKAQTFLFLADMLEAQSEISSWKSRENGSGTVITDRYVASTYAYAKAQHEPRWGNNADADADKNNEWLDDAIGMLPNPDAYVFLTPGALRDTADGNGLGFLAEREGFGEDNTETTEIQRRVVQHMNEFATRREAWAGHRGMPAVITVVVGANDTPETICDEFVIPRLAKALAEDRFARRRSDVAQTMPSLI